MRNLAVLILLVISSFMIAARAEAERPAAISCLEKFIERYDRIESYSARMTKTEYVRSAKGVTQEIELASNGSNISLTYVDVGSTGIKNNGMRVTFDGSDQLKVKLGKAHGLGVFINTPAKLITGKQISISDPQVVDDEVFTVNRAGFGYLAAVLKKKLKGLEQGELGILAANGDNCDISYRPQSDASETFRLLKTASVFEAEEKFGTLAFILFRANSDKFKKFSELFRRSKDVDLKVPKEFVAFDLSIDRKNYLPTKFVLYWHQERIAEYIFANIIAHERK